MKEISNTWQPEVKACKRVAEPSSTTSAPAFPAHSGSYSLSIYPYKTQLTYSTQNIQTGINQHINAQFQITNYYIPVYDTKFGNLYSFKKKMKPIDDKKDTVTIRAVSRNEEGRKMVEKTELNTHNIDTVKYVEKKLRDKGVQRMERHPADGIGLNQPPPKSGRGGKYTWEGPIDPAEAEFEAVPAAIDEKDPNYVDGEEEEKIVRGEKSDVAGMVVGEVEVAKAAEHREGVARVDVDPQLNA